MSNVNTVRFKKNWSVKQTASFYDLGSDQMWHQAGYNLGFCNNSSSSPAVAVSGYNALRKER